MALQEAIPKRSSFWFAEGGASSSFLLFNRSSLVLSVILALFAFFVFWPIIAQIDFEEAFFTPLVPLLLNLMGLIGMSANDAMRVLFITSFMASCVGVYLLAYSLVGRQLTAILAALLYLMPPVPVFVLSLFGNDYLGREIASAKSFFTIVYGDGAQFLALAIVPIAVIFSLKFLKRAAIFDFLMACGAGSLVLIADRLQAFNLLIILLVLSSTEVLLGEARAKIKRLAMLAIFSLGLVSFWYTPSFWMVGMAPLVAGIANSIKLLFPLPFILGLLLILFSFVFFGRRQDRQAIFIATLTFLVFIGVFVIWLLHGRSFVPHPYKLVPNVNMFGAIIGSLAVVGLLDKLRLVERIGVQAMSQVTKILGGFTFGVLVLVAVSAIVYFISPLFILLLAGPAGIWTRIRLNVLADRAQTLSLAGENFKLIGTNADPWEIWFGIGMSIIFLAISANLIFRQLAKVSPHGDE